MNYLVKRSSIIASGEGDFGHVAEDEVALVEPPRWVPVSERLPEEGVAVLCLARTPGTRKKRRHAILTYNGDLWRDRSGLCFDVSHWTPLPPGPEE